MVYFKYTNSVYLILKVNKPNHWLH